jgi:hypothetical protein
MSIACVASDVHACDRSVYLGGGDAERARIRLLRGSNTAGCNWRRDFRISVFPLDMPRPPFFDVDKGGGPKTFFRKPPRHFAALVHIVAGGAGMPNPTHFGACAAGEAVSIVHDVRYLH